MKLGEWRLPHAKDTVEIHADIQPGDSGPVVVSLRCLWPEVPPHPRDIRFYREVVRPKMMHRLEKRLGKKGLVIEV